MKRKIFFSIIIIVALATFTLVSRLSSAGSPLKVVPTATPIIVTNNRFSSGLDKAKTIVHNQKSYRVAWFPVEVSRLELIGNFTDKRDSEDIIANEGCENLSSAGFYDTNHEPLGLWQSKQSVKSKAESNRFLNAFVSVTHEEQFTISQITPNNTGKLSFQTGPLLLKNGVTQKLQIKADEFRRRVIAVTSIKKEPFIVVIFGTDGIFTGPELEEVPSLLKTAEPVFGFAIDNAVNLDGGSASVFRTNEVYLSELNPVGSFLCVK